MTAEEWLNSKDTINRSKRPYAHFDWRTDINQQREYISTPEKVSAHGFYPFIHYKKQYLKYAKRKGKKEKIRDICYAAHIDRCIYQYYSYILNSLYNERVKADGISSVAVAYRTDLQKNNIHFSKYMFDYIKKQAPVYIMIGDFTGFFDNLDHLYLKKQWCSLLGTERLPPDHFSVFKSVTAYSTWELSDLLYLNNLEDTKAGRKILNSMPRVLTLEQFKENRSHIQKHEEPFGIPQGSPISGTLANIYMLEIDKMINDTVHELGGIYMRYSDDFMIVLPDNPNITAATEFRKINEIINRVPKLELEPDKTQYFYYDTKNLINCGSTFDLSADNNKNINFLGFSFDGRKIRIRAKTVSKYYYRMYRKARNITKKGGYTTAGKHISCKNLYLLYSKKGAKLKSGNFLTYVDRAAFEYGPEELISKDTKRHMEKIRRALKSDK